jgi:hypothetical protein
MWANVHQMNSAIVDNTWNSTLAWHKFLMLNYLQSRLTTMLKYDQKHTNSLNFKALALVNLSLTMFVSRGQLAWIIFTKQVFHKRHGGSNLFVCTMNMTRRLIWNKINTQVGCWDIREAFSSKQLHII